MTSPSPPPPTRGQAAHVNACDLGEESGYVPSSFLALATPDGVMLGAFEGEGEGELPSAFAGDPVWQIDPHETREGGWVQVRDLPSRLPRAPRISLISLTI